MRPAALILALILAASPAAADEFTDTMNGALEAYAQGDVAVASEELEYATTLLNAMKAEALAKFLPAPPPGWTRAEAADDGSAAAMAMFGGGTTASATYTRDGVDLTVSLVADSPMVTGIGGMLSGLASVSETKPIRIQRTQFTQNEGELQGVVDDNVLVSVGGAASVEDKTAFLEAMDLGALADF